MANASFWKTDWFLGLLVSALMLLAGRSELLQSLERKAYDMGLQAGAHTPSDRIAVIAIDDQSIANLGRWPWPRDLHARLNDLLAPAKVVGNTIFFSEPQLDPGYAYITRLINLLPVVEEGEAPLSPDMEKIAQLLKEAEGRLNADRTLSESYGKTGNVILPLLFQMGEMRGRPDQTLPAFVLKNRLPQQIAEGEAILSAQSVQYPIETLATQVLGLGHLNALPDVDGAIRAEPLVVRYGDQVFPSFSLLLAARSLNLGLADIQLSAGNSLRLGRLSIATDELSQMHPFYYRDAGGRPAFQVDSFYDVLSGKIPASKYAGKIVLVGATAAGVGASQVTPISPAMAPVLTLAHTVSSILQEHFFVTPTWAGWVSLGAFLLISFYLIALLPRLSAAQGAMFTLCLGLILLAAHFALMRSAGWWIPLMNALALLLVGHLLLTTKRFLVTERGKEKSELESAESNRMLGLAFQGQGQLDMAFDKFRKCPMDDGLMENMYNLALDYERKRQFNKAEAVFRYVFDFDARFRDVDERLARAKQLSETILLGSGQGQTVGGTVILGNAGQEKPMLGRYQIEKVLGKGAMGEVYLGRDPKINRIVAIKTMALGQEFSSDELAEVKTRFFREAESAGRLSHPNIVTMFDAGEEHDLAYIAMEFLKGGDLTPHTKADALLPLSEVLNIALQIADALDYAHAQQVVHRDIKPANVMYEAKSRQVKVTDFGIARITDASRTRTGVVLGTPSYMSPEQLVGKKVDGRSDLYSLGVMLYQLTCGQLPFVGESMAQLMYRIANEAAPDIRSINPALPLVVKQVIDKAMMKNVLQRYQTGAEMVADLRACQAALIT